MTAEVVNLRRARKKKQRTERSVEAAANRAAFGRTRAERQDADLARAREIRHLDGHRLEGRGLDGADDGRSL